MKRLAAASILALVLSASNVAGSQPRAGIAYADICDAIATEFSGPQGSPIGYAYEHAWSFERLMLHEGWFDLDGDGDTEHAYVDRGGTASFAYVAVEGLDKEARNDRPELSAKARDRVNFADEFGFMPFGGRWHVVTFADRFAQDPSGAYYFAEDGERQACVFERELKLNVGGEDPAPGIRCADLPDAPEIQPDPSDRPSDSDIAALAPFEFRVMRAGDEDTRDHSGLLVHDDVFNIDFDDDGRPERVALVEYRWGGGRTCTSMQFRLLPDKNTTTVDEAKRIDLLKRQGLYARDRVEAMSGCQNTYTWRQAGDKVVLDTRAGDTSGFYSMGRGGDALKMCSKSFDAKFSVIYREGQK